MKNKWNDEFDFEDQPQKRKQKINENRKSKPQTTLNDYYDLEEDPNKNLKLPTISKNIGNSNEKNSKSTTNVNLAQISKKKTQNASNKKTQFEDEEYYFEESVAPNPSSVKRQSPPKKNQSKKLIQAKPVQQEYDQQEFEKQQKYEEDFQIEEKKPSPIIYKPNQPPKVTPKSVNIPKPAPKDRKGDSLAKKTQVSVKINSRNSVRSQSASRVAHSKSKNEQKKEQPPNKYCNLVERSIINYEKSALQSLNLDKLVRENDKIRGMIKKFNDQLNDLINKNIMQLKNKKQQKIISFEEIIKNLQEQKNSGETVYQTTVRELQRLKGKQGELKEEEYQLVLQQKIVDAKTAINQYTKNITKLKLDINNEGNKLSKIDKETTNVQDTNSIKNNYLLVKKQEEKNDETLEKLYIKFEQLTRKNSESEAKYNAYIQQAKQKGLSFQNNTELIKKCEDLKKKIEIGRQHKLKTESLYKTKCEMVVHESDQVRNQIKAVENLVQFNIKNCQQMQNQSKKLVEKARKNSKISEEMVNSLEAIIAELQNSAASQSTREKEDLSSFSYPKGAKKYQSVKNVEKINPQAYIREPQKDKNAQDNSKKPNLFKKKEKQEQKSQQRVWKDDKNNESKKNDKNVTSPIPQLSKFQDKQEPEKKDDQKKKPFQIKKNKDLKTQIQANQELPKEEIKPQKIEKNQIIKQAQKAEETPHLAPRMMKFKRAKHQQGPKEQIEKKPQLPAKNIQIQKKNQQKLAQEQPQQPIYAPKRFQLRPKERNNQDGGFLSSVVDKKPETNAAQQFKPKGLSISKQVAVSEIKNDLPKISEQKNSLNQEQQKPKFNLKLRDRKRQSERPQAKIQVPVGLSQQPQGKINIILDDKTKQNKIQYTNPYAANANIQPRQNREGPLKKQKIISNGQKSNVNIYDQAEDITNVKQVNLGNGFSKQNELNSKKPSQQPSLQDLLGIKKKRNSLDDDLIVDSKIVGAKPLAVKQKKKDTNFFGDLEI